MRTHQTILATFALLFGASPCFSQNIDNNTNVGTPENGLFHGGTFDTVQLANGNLHIEIPLWATPGRGVPTGAFFVLDSNQWRVTYHTDRNGIVSAGVVIDWSGAPGGAFRGPGDYLFVRQSVPKPHSYCQYFQYYQVMLREPNGTKHHMQPDPGPDQGPNCALNQTVWFADDGSGLEYNSSTGPVTKAGWISGTMDTNGNYTSTTDTLGRTLQFSDSSGNPLTIQVNYTSVPAHTNFCPYITADNCSEFSGNLSEVSQIILPNGMTYTFNYVHNDLGEPSSMTLPSGAQIGWTWATYDGGEWPEPAVTSRSETVGGQVFTWTYGHGSAPGTSMVQTIIDPLGNETDLAGANVPLGPAGCSYQPIGVMIGTKQFFSGNGTSKVLLRTETTDYSNAYCAVQPIRVTTTWNQTNQVSKVETDYDSFAVPGISSVTLSASNPTARREYDWGTGAPGNLLRRTAFSYLHLANSNYLSANILDRVTSKTVYDSANNTCQGLSQACAVNSYSYDSTTITSTSSTQAPNHDYTGHGSTFTVRGNLTQTSHWLNSSGAWLNTTNTFDDLGNLRSTMDPNGNVTSYNYTDNFTDGTNRNAQAFVTQITHPVTNGVNHIEKKQYFWYTSLVAASCGQNFSAACVNNASLPQPDYVTFTYDSMRRPLAITRGDGGITTGSYNDTSLPLSVAASSSITSALSKTTTTLFDDLYRLKQTQLTSDQQGTVFTDTTYDALGRKSTVTNPHRSAASPTDGTTTFFYDALGRSCLLVPPDGTQPSPGVSCPSTRPTGDVLTTYSGNTVTVTDQAGISRKSVADGLGRLTQVFEDPAGLNYETDYQYDALENLTRVDQKGGDSNTAHWRTRIFAYNSLSQLLCAANPEIQMVTCHNPDSGTYTAGTTRYSYDNNGNLTTKKSPKPNQTSGSVTVTATYAYDALNRVTSKSFDNGDPTINYAFDGVVPTGWPTACAPGTFSFGNSIGKRTAMCDAAGMELWGSSITSGIGWMTTDQRTTNSVTKTATYQNNFGGGLATLTYPSGRAITYTPDGVGRTSKVVDFPNSINYVVGTCANGTDNFGVCYTPPGSPSSLTNGANLLSTFYYNPRLQPCRMSVKSSGTAPVSCTDTALGNVLDFNYNFNLGASDNGNVIKITNNRDTTRDINYGYDTLNRIAYAYTDGNLWGETYQIDPWGSLNKILPYTGKPQPENLNQTAGPNNQFTGMSYDAAGNLLNDGASNYAFDGESRVTTAAGVAYTYDGSGKRVKKSSGKLYWYGLGNDTLNETDLAGNTNNSTFNEFVFFGGRRIARRDSSGNVFYYLADHLGTSRVMFQSGQTSPCYDADFYPYGVERTPVVNSCPQNYKFTGKERDSESGLDNFGARYNSSILGRFMTPDWAARPTSVPYAVFSNPQTLNLYSYSTNNPTSHADADGHWDPWEHVEITTLSYAQAHLPVDERIVTGVRDRDGGGLGGHNPYVAWLVNRAEWKNEQYSQGTQANHFLRDRSQSQLQAYVSGIDELRSDAGHARLALQLAGPGAARQATEDALHLIQDSFAHTARVGGNGAITHIQCFTCAHFGGGYDHQHPDLRDANGQLTNQGQGSVNAGAAFLTIMQNAATMSDTQFNNAIENFLSQFFSQELNNDLTSETGGEWVGGWVGGAIPPRKQ
jgi:RHS repeat-associated protein